MLRWPGFECPQHVRACVWHMQSTDSHTTALTPEMCVPGKVRVPKEVHVWLHLCDALR